MPALEYDTYNAYIEDIKNKDIKLLSLEEEIRLGKRIKEKDKEAVKKLVESNLKLVIDIANDFRSSGIEFAELIAIGNEALVKAAWNFDYTKEVRFSTYATIYIKGIINSEMGSYKVSTYRNRYLHRKINRFYKVYNSFDESDRDRLQKTTEILGMTIEDGNEVLLLSSGTLSLNSKITVDSDDEMIDLLQDDINFENDILDKLFIDEIFNSDYLSDREKKILKLKYGYEIGNPLLNMEIAKIMNLEPANVSRISKSALRKIRRKTMTQEDLKK